jgi:hypothetical protein
VLSSNGVGKFAEGLWDAMPRADIEAEFVVATGLNGAGLRLLFYVLLTEFTSSWPGCIQMR